MSTLHLLYQLAAVALGLVLGSFWNVCIARWPDASVIRPRSRCPACRESIAAFDNIPIVSWFILRGHCRCCGTPISPTYPLIELLGGLLGFLLYRRFVPVPADLDEAHLAAFALYFTFASALVVGAFIDVRDHILPDETTLWTIPIGVGGAALLQALGYTGWLDLGWREAVLGATAGWVFFKAMAWSAYGFTGVEALGEGDVRLLAAIGSFTGPLGVLFVAFGASATQAVFGLAATAILRQRVYLPFGPALAYWALTYVLYGDVLLEAWFPMLARTFGVV